MSAKPSLVMESSFWIPALRSSVIIEVRVESAISVRQADESPDSFNPAIEAAHPVMRPLVTKENPRSKVFLILTQGELILPVSDCRSAWLRSEIHKGGVDERKAKLEIADSTGRLAALRSSITKPDRGGEI